MEVQLKETQKKIFESISSQKQLLQSEFGKLVQRENELVASILEALDIKLVEGISLQGDRLIIPESPVKSPELPYETKLKKSK